MAAPTIPNGEEHFFPIIYEGNGAGRRVGKFVPFTDNASIANSCIFDAASNVSLTRTPSGAGNRKTFTVSVWAKRCVLTDAAGNNTYGQRILNVGASGSSFFDIKWSGSGDTEGANRLHIREYSSSAEQIEYWTNRTFEDTSKWYHILLQVDTTQVSSGDRIKLYVDGDQVTSWYRANAPSSNFDTLVNSTVLHNIGRFTGATSNNLSGYLAEFNLVDGSIVAPSTFGLTDTSTGRWIPKSLTGITYGTNGFRLTFADSSAFGDDTSGNGNDYASSNLVSTDQTTDSPTQNHNTFASFASGTSASEGNLTVSTGTTNGDTQCVAQAGFGVATGKWYWEAKITTVGAGLYGWKDDANAGGSQAVNTSSNGTHSTNNSAGMLSTAASGAFSAGSWFIDGGYGDEVNYTTVSTNDVLMFAIDLDTGKGYCGKNGTWFNSANPANGTGEIGGCHYANGVNKFYPMARRLDANSVAEYNFGQRSFAHTPPTGFSALQQDNLPATDKGVSDLVIIKNRDAADSWIWQDSLRGNQEYGSSSTATQYNTAIVDGVQKFLAGGFSTEDNDAINTSGESYVAYNFHLNGGTTTTDSSGTLSTELQANATAGFSVGKFTVSGSGNVTWAHGLGGVPEMGILCAYNSTNSGTTYHHKISTTPYSSGLFLTNSNSAFTSSNIWGLAKPTSTLWTGLVGSLFTAGEPYIFYSFRGIEGFSKFGSYVGNGNADGPFVYTGFKPAWLMIKRTDVANSWGINDSTRNPFNPAKQILWADYTLADENRGDRPIDLLSNGYKVRALSSETNCNASGGTYIYMAFAEHPFNGDGTNPVTAR